MGNQAKKHSEAILPRKLQSSYSSAVEFSVQHERLCSLESVASEYSTLVARKGMCMCVCVCVCVCIFFKWPIAGSPPESAHRSTKTS